MLLEEKRKVWQALKFANIKVNSDFTKVINDTFKIDISLSKYKDENLDLLCCLYQNDLQIYHVEHIPVDCIDVVLDALEDITYSLQSKIVTKVDEELLDSNGIIDCDYRWFMDHASYVLDKPFYSEYTNEDKTSEDENNG